PPQRGEPLAAVARQLHDVDGHGHRGRLGLRRTTGLGAGRVAGLTRTPRGGDWWTATGQGPARVGRRARGHHGERGHGARVRAHLAGAAAAVVPVVLAPRRFRDAVPRRPALLEPFRKPGERAGPVRWAREWVGLRAPAKPLAA